MVLLGGEMAKLAFVIGGTLVTLFGGFLVTIGYDIVTVSTCTHISPSEIIGNCRTSIAGIPLSWVNAANNNIVQTIIGTVMTFGGAILLVIIFAGALTHWLRSRNRKA
jgi:hypothetical protein